MAFITMNGDVNDHIMVIDVSVQIKVGFSPILYCLLTLCELIQSHKELLSLQPMFPPKPFDIFPLNSE